MKRILVVDDELQIRRMLRTSLQSSGYEVLLAADGMEGFRTLEEQQPDLVITDLSMPNMNGLELTQAIRRTTQTIPIIVLSVRDAEPMKIHALDEGADDYLTKPFSMPELLARVRAHLRRSSAETPTPAVLEVGDFVINVEAHTVRLHNQALHLTPKEFELLLLFARSPEKVLTHRVLLRAIWGPMGDDQPEYLRVLVAGLRKKVELTEGHRYIQSEPWVGYRFHPQSNKELTVS